MALPLYGLVLAGGRSTRMQRDKATLTYQGRNQLERAMALLEPCVVQAFVSVRPDQRQDPARARVQGLCGRNAGDGTQALVRVDHLRIPGARRIFALIRPDGHERLDHARFQQFHDAVELISPLVP